jgi:putative membrane protein
MFLGHYGMWFLLPLFLFSRFLWLVVLALLIWGLVRLFSSRRVSFYHPGAGAGVPPVPPVQPSAMEILRQRYARGEIDAATFDQMRERLETSSRSNQ